MLDVESLLTFARVLGHADHALSIFIVGDTDHTVTLKTSVNPVVAEMKYIFVYIFTTY
jgi:hypothetical protein